MAYCPFGRGKMGPELYGSIFGRCCNPFDYCDYFTQTHELAFLCRFYPIYDFNRFCSGSPLYYWYRYSVMAQYYNRIIFISNLYRDVNIFRYYLQIRVIKALSLIELSVAGKLSKGMDDTIPFFKMGRMFKMNSFLNEENMIPI